MLGKTQNQRIVIFLVSEDKVIEGVGKIGPVRIEVFNPASKQFYDVFYHIFYISAHQFLPTILNQELPWSFIHNFFVESRSSNSESLWLYVKNNRTFLLRNAGKGVHDLDEGLIHFYFSDFFNFFLKDGRQMIPYLELLKST